jgi:hypothetical protein
VLTPFWITQPRSPNSRCFLVLLVTTTVYILVTLAKVWKWCWGTVLLRRNGEFYSDWKITGYITKTEQRMRRSISSVRRFPDAMLAARWRRKLRYLPPCSLPDIGNKRGGITWQPTRWRHQCQSAANPAMKIREEITINSFQPPRLPASMFVLLRDFILTLNPALE